jgi:hypothetical protein
MIDSFHIISLSSAKINLGKDTSIKNGSQITLRSGYRNTIWSTGARGDSIEVTKAGTYWAALKGDKCEVSDTIQIIQNAGIENYNRNRISGMQLYPNPAHGTLTVSFNIVDAAEYSVNIYDIKGKLVLAQKYSSVAGANTYDINISSLAAGEYILNMVSDHSSVLRKFEVGE